MFADNGNMNPPQVSSDTLVLLCHPRWKATISVEPGGNTLVCFGERETLESWGKHATWTSAYLGRQILRLRLCKLYGLNYIIDTGPAANRSPIVRLQEIL